MTLPEKRALLSSWDTIIEMAEKNLEWAKEQRARLAEDIADSRSPNEVWFDCLSRMAEREKETVQ